MTLRSIPRSAWRGTLGRLPPRVAFRLFRSWVDVIADDHDARRALRRLFAIDDLVRLELDRTAIRYDDGVHVKHRLTRYHDFFVERIEAGERVLDLGCGVGALAADIAERTGARVTGVDSSAENLRRARERYGALETLELVEGDLRRYVPGGRFDVVVLSNVLEHLPAREQVLRDIVARTGASRLLIRVPVFARDWTVPLRRELGLAFFSDPTHEVEYDRASLAAELRGAGLEIVHEEIAWGEIWAEARPSVTPSGR